jgi:exopolysaccharide biosynthesis polyprenyl glycosylphosphotransferase
VTEQLNPTWVSEVDLDTFGWDIDVSSAREEIVPLPSRRRLSGRPSRIIDGVTTFHSAAPSALTMIADLVVLAALAGFVSAHPLSRVTYPLTVVALGYLTQLYAERDSVETRGVLWFPGRLVPALAGAGALFLALRASSVVEAVWLAAGSLTGLTAVRTLSWVCLLVARRRGLGLRPTLIIGPVDGSAILWRRLVEFPEAGLLPVQLLAYETARTRGVVEEQLRRRDIAHVVLVAPSSVDADVTRCLPRHAEQAPFVSITPALADLYVDPRSMTEVGGIPLIPLGRPTRLRHQFPGKRAFDVVISAMLLLLLAPVMAVVALAVKLCDGGPVLFRQARVGRGCEVFRIAKFRTMVEGASELQAALAAHNVTDGLLFKLRVDPRVTRIGGFLRRTAVDELPQLWNVLRGDMSLVGPRPLAVDPHEFSPAESERHSVQPGITGYWQLSGGNELSYAEMIRLDLAYIRHWSLWLDVQLLLRTVPALIHRHGAS